jgi:hypothetical protein
MKHSLKILLAVAFIQLSSQYVIGQGDIKPLFSTDNLLEFRIKMNVEEVTTDLKERVEHEATLTYKNPDGMDKELNIKVNVRGKTRTNVRVCKFPPLKLNFKKKKVANTIFAGQNKLKLVTHCNTKTINEEYILREYYVYKVYQLVSQYSLKVRLCKVIYEDTNGEFDATPHYGILIEDIDDLAERNGMIEYEGKVINQESCNREELDKLMLFQYLIGNLDWSVPKRHNFKLIADAEKPLPIAVPYDFDYCGMVNTTYAKVPAEIDVASVRTRVFRGLCRMEGGYDEPLAYFQQIKPEIYAIYEESEYLSDKSKANAIKYLNDFYKVLDNPKQTKVKILEACRVRHKHMFQY